MIDNLSVIIIARNEEKDIVDCLKSVNDIASDVIVIENGSTDNTSLVAKKHKAKVVEYPKPADEGHFGDLRNFAVKQAKGDWVLFVDADERLDEKLKDEIKMVISKNAAEAFAIPRRNILLGKEMKHGGWWPDYVLRLFKREAFTGYVGKVHEQPLIKGETKKLKHPFVHLTHQNITEMLDKTNKWSEIEARLLIEAHHPPMTILRFFSAGFREFWKRGIVKGGFLDGKEGAIEVFYQVYSRLITYAKLWELQLK